MVDRARLSPPPGLEVSERRLENDFCASRSARTVRSPVSSQKPTGREALAGRGNQLWVYPQDKPREWDAWDIDEDYAARGEEVRARSKACARRTNARTARRAASRAAGGSSTIAQTYRLAANGARLEIDTRIDWRDRRTLLRTLTPAAVRADHASCECAYGVIERPTHRNTSWEEAMFEAAAHRFVDLSEPGFGLALLNDGKYGHSVRDNVLGLSLVRSPVYPDPLADEGEQRFTYALCPTPAAA